MAYQSKQHYAAIIAQIKADGLYKQEREICSPQSAFKIYRYTRISPFGFTLVFPRRSITHHSGIRNTVQHITKFAILDSLHFVESVKQDEEHQYQHWDGTGQHDNASPGVPLSERDVGQEGEGAHNADDEAREDGEVVEVRERAGEDEDGQGEHDLYQLHPRLADHLPELHQLHQRDADHPEQGAIRPHLGLVGREQARSLQTQWMPYVTGSHVQRVIGLFDQKIVNRLSDVYRKRIVTDDRL
jgi:hypothetical protein